MRTAQLTCIQPALPVIEPDLFLFHIQELAVCNDRKIHQVIPQLIKEIPKVDMAAVLQMKGEILQDAYPVGILRLNIAGLCPDGIFPDIFLSIYRHFRAH